MTDTVTLEPPGAGLPWHKRLVARLMLPRYARRTSEATALAFFRAEGGKLLTLVRSLGAEQLAERVLVPRLQGLEDSSRYWSVAMTLEHLEIVNYAMGTAVVELSHGRLIAGQIGTADVKPHAAVEAAAAIASFEASLARFEARLAERAQPMDARARYPHPWFGPLTAHQWLCLVGVHMRIHRKQIEAVIAGLGRPGPRVIETPRAG